MPFEPEIRAAAAKYQIPFDLLYAQVRQESSFNPLAVSRCGARGLLQLMPAAGRECGLLWDEDFFDAQKNLLAGACYLKRQYKSCTSMLITMPKTVGGRDVVNICEDDDYWMLALAAYNGGIGYVIRAINLCAGDGDPLGSANILAKISSPLCRVNGRRPDHKQITDYVARIWAEYEHTITPTSPLKGEGDKKKASI